jgi:cobyrinic acid a,c-diamide synthase
VSARASPPGLIIAAPASGSGKTTITVGLIAALRARGLDVAPAKAGPDFIDPGFHAAAAGRPSINLDPWAMRPRTLAAAVADMRGDIALCEAAMGLFDGIDAAGSASAGDLATRLGWPVVLVVDASGQAASVAALVEGFKRHRADVDVAGVILNRAGSARHAALLEASLARVDGIAALGTVLRDDALVVPERHLGLVPAGEAAETAAFVTAAQARVAEAVDLDRLVALARPASLPAVDGMRDGVPPPGSRIAIARDDAFVFAYPALLESWRARGAALSFFAPLADEPPAADADAVFLPGGYPELHAGRLAAAARFMSGLQSAASRATIYGECGGYMVLGEGLVDSGGARHAMAGLLPLETSFAARRLHLGYRSARLLADTVLGRAGTVLRGHEFHYSQVLAERGADALFEIADASGRTLGTAGRRRGAVMGSFIHVIDRWS